MSDKELLELTEEDAEPLNSGNSRSNDSSNSCLRTALPSASGSWTKCALLAIVLAVVFVAGIIDAVWAKEARQALALTKKIRHRPVANEDKLENSSDATPARPVDNEDRYPLVVPVAEPRDWDLVCSEDIDWESERRRQCHDVPSLESRLGEELKADLKYHTLYYFEPSSAIVRGSCRYRCRSEWKAYCPKDGPKEVTSALRVMEGPRRKVGFKKKYLAVRPQAVVLLGRFYGSREHVGLRRPAARARSLYDLTRELRDSPRGFDLLLAEIVHSALSQACSFREKTEYPFHGQLSSHTVEVEVGLARGPVVVHLRGFAEAIAWHLEEENLEGIGTPRLPKLAPPEAEEHRLRTDKFDVWSAGLAILEKLCHNHDAPAAQPDDFTRICGDIFSGDTLSRLSASQWARHCTRVTDFLTDRGCSFANVLKNTIAVDCSRRWGMEETLENLQKLISQLERKAAAPSKEYEEKARDEARQEAAKEAEEKTKMDAKKKAQAEAATKKEPEKI